MMVLPTHQCWVLTFSTLIIYRLLTDIWTWGQSEHAQLYNKRSIKTFINWVWVTVAFSTMVDHSRGWFCTMKVLTTALLLVTLQCSHALSPTNCDASKPLAEKVLDLINKGRRSGYTFQLLRVSDAHLDRVVRHGQWRIGAGRQRVRGNGDCSPRPGCFTQLTTLARFPV